MFEQTVKAIGRLDSDAMFKAQERLNNLTKPLGSLGVLEAIAKQLSGITGEVIPTIKEKKIIIMAGDHGVVEEGVSAFPQEVTPQMVANFVHKGAAINVLTKHVGAEVRVVDIGVAGDIADLPITHAKVKKGTNNFTKGPAMTREEAVKALEVGIAIANEEIDRGVNLLGTGEMGIGNTTPSSAILSVLGGYSPEDVTGRGTGIDDKGLAIKQEVIAKGIAFNNPNPNDPIDVLSKVGGFEIAGLAGVILGAAARRVPVVIDGFISSAAALIAKEIAPNSVNFMIPSHGSQEPGHALMMELLGLKPILHLEMRLGEGTGAALAMNVVEASIKIIGEMATFAEAGVSEGTA